MNINDIIESLKGHHGQNINAVWARRAGTLQEHADRVIIKHTDATVRGGVDYANMAGAPEEVGPLPWGEWNVFPVAIVHKGNDYARFAKPSGGISQKPKVHWTLDGVPVEYSVVEPMLLAKEKSSDKASPVFVVKAADVVSVGRR